MAPQISPDGKRIAFASQRSGTWEIWVCNSDGSSHVHLTFFQGPNVTTPRWSPDGGQIAFDSDAGAEQEFDIWVIDGAQFTSDIFTSRLEKQYITISMDGRGRAIDNIFIERLWRTVKYEEVYLKDYSGVLEAKKKEKRACGN